MSSRANATEAQRIAALLSGASLELSSRDPAEIDACIGILEPGTAIYISSPPGQTFRDTLALALRIRRAGFRPVPHLAARRIASRAALEDFMARAVGEAAVDSALLIAGDLAQASGPFESSLSLLETGLFERQGIVNIGVAGYPEGHPVISGAALDAALAAKVALAVRAALNLQVVTQFCFEAQPVVDWALRQQKHGIALHVGIAGPASLARLLRFAARCGVGNSVRALRARPSAIGRLLSEAGPELMLRALASQAPPPLAGIHFFCFGGLLRSARWLQAVQAGRMEFDAEGGFQLT
jgi:methylenetetrahydrofolate reductase (NADPH)